QDVVIPFSSMERERSRCLRLRYKTNPPARDGVRNPPANRATSSRARTSHEGFLSVRAASSRCKRDPHATGCLGVRKTLPGCHTHRRCKSIDRRVSKGLRTNRVRLSQRKCVCTSFPAYGPWQG